MTTHLALYVIFGNAAYLLNVAAFWMTNVRWLRVLVIASSLCFAAYAATVPGGPLMIMIGWSLLFTAINVVRLFTKSKTSPLLVIHRQADLPLGSFTNVPGLRIMVVDRANLDGDGVVVVPPARMSLGATGTPVSVDPAEAESGGVIAGFRIKTPVFAAGLVSRLQLAARVPPSEPGTTRLIENKEAA